MANEDSTFSAADWKSADSKQRKILMAERAKAQEERQKKEVQELTAQQKRIKELKANMALREKWDVQLSKTQDEMLLKQREMEQQLKRELNQKEIYAIKTEQALKFEARAIEQKDALKDVTKKLLEFQQKQLFLDTKEAKQQADSIRAKEHQLKVQEDLAAGIEDIKKAEQELAFSRSAEGKLQVKNQARAAKIREQIQKEQEERGALVKELKGSVKEYFDVFTSAIPKPAMILGKMGLRGIKGIGRGLLGAGRGIGGMLGFGKKKGAQATEKAEKKKEDRQETQLGLQQDQAANIEKLTEHMTGEAATKDGEEGESWFGKIKKLFIKFGPMIMGLGTTLLATLSGWGAAIASGFTSMLGGIGPTIAKFLGPAALLAGIVMLIKDGIAGYFASDKWGTSKTSGVIGGLFGGVDSGLKGALWGGMKWALIGAGIGSIFPVIGTAIGGAVGALLGVILGWIGGEKIAKAIDKLGKWIGEQWDSAVALFQKGFTALFEVWDTIEFPTLGDINEGLRSLVRSILPKDSNTFLGKIIPDAIWEYVGESKPKKLEDVKTEGAAGVAGTGISKSDPSYVEPNQESNPEKELARVRRLLKAEEEKYAKGAGDTGRLAALEAEKEKIKTETIDSSMFAGASAAETDMMVTAFEGQRQSRLVEKEKEIAEQQLKNNERTTQALDTIGDLRNQIATLEGQSAEASKATDESVQMGLGVKQHKKSPPFLSWMPDIAKNIAAMASAIGVASTLGLGGGDPASAGKTSGTEPSKAPTAVSSTKSPAATKATGGQIDWKFIAEKEGGSKTEGYVPNAKGSKSGVTIATGFDLGARNLNDIGALPKPLQAKLAPYLGLHGMEAELALKNRPLKITSDEATLIDKMSKGEAVKRLKDKWNKKAAATGGKRFEELTSEQATVAASVAFQYGDMETRTPNFWKQVTSGDWEGAVANLEHFGDDYSTRRKSEAELLKKGAMSNMGKALTQTEADLDAAKAQGKGTQAPPVMNTTVVNNNTGGNTTQIGSRTVRNTRSSGNNTTVGHGAS